MNINSIFPATAGRAPDKQVCFSLERANSPYETVFPVTQTEVPYLQRNGLEL